MYTSSGDKWDQVSAKFANKRVKWFITIFILHHCKTQPKRRLQQKLNKMKSARALRCVAIFPYKARRRSRLLYVPCFSRYLFYFHVPWKCWHRAKNRLRDKTGFGTCNLQNVEKSDFGQSVCVCVCLSACLSVRQSCCSFCGEPSRA